MAKKTGPKSYGTNEYEQAVGNFIVHSRRQGRKLREIIDDLHCRALYPRRAIRWSPGLVFNAHRRAMEREAMKDG
jgi:hypothetical protein